jgi:multidrug efflux pump
LSVLSPAWLLWGYSLDNLVANGTDAFASGFAVDDADRDAGKHHASRGGRARIPIEAAMIGSKEVTFTILSMTISLIAVFIL